MSRFLVTETELVAEDRGPDEEPGDAQAEAVAVHAADDTRAVAAAIRGVEERGASWSVFEREGSRYARRAVIFRMDGRFAYDVEISR